MDTDNSVVNEGLGWGRNQVEGSNGEEKGAICNILNNKNCRIEEAIR